MLERFRLTKELDRQIHRTTPLQNRPEMGTTNTQPWWAPPDHTHPLE